MSFGRFVIWQNCQKYLETILDSDPAYCAAIRREFESHNLTWKVNDENYEKIAVVDDVDIGQYFGEIIAGS